MINYVNYNITMLRGKPMDKKEAARLKMKQMTIEEKIALLSETEEAYIRGFIEGAILWGYEASKQNNSVKAKPTPQKR